jgi:8-oxo-dGTP pyrophosphatase MutT (NUDIX family)
MTLESETFCSNCANIGHLFHNCKYPITSVGIIVYRINNINNKIEYLMIRRKDTIGYIEFIRGKYPLNNKEYIKNIISEMTIDEKNKITTLNFNELWGDIWGKTIGIQYRGEETAAKNKFELLKKGIADNNNDLYSINTLINEINNEKKNDIWKEQEWGFPKGRHNFQEKDMACALREFEEETGYLKTNVKIIQNLVPVEEIFTGSNYKSYKHKYFLGYMDFKNSTYNYNQTAIQNNNEVSMIEWKDYESALLSIRLYNLEKIDCLTRVHTILSNYTIC